MKKILVTCRAGVGTSTMMTVQVRNVASKKGWDVDVTHSNTDGAGSFNGDAIVALGDVADDLKESGIKVPVVGIKNMMDANEIEEKLTPIMEG